MAAKTKNTSLPSHVAIILLALYNVALVIYSFGQHDGVNLLFYSLFPDMMGVFLWVYSFHQSQHTEKHLRTIATDIAAVRTYVEALVGQPEELSL